jgi:hypothetical protein
MMTQGKEQAEIHTQIEASPADAKSKASPDKQAAIIAKGHKKV